jgi:isoquinoline 1-oxidoreductase alpha subunit
MPTLLINGQEQELDVPDDMPLLWVLRDVVGLTGTKFGCGIALCGACTVHVDGRPIRSCITPVASMVGKKITTIEAIGETASGAKIQRAWLSLEVVQCGYCQTGQIMSAAALIESNPNPTDAEIDAAMSGNICRCGTYPRIRTAINRHRNPLEAKSWAMLKRINDEKDKRAEGFLAGPSLNNSGAAGGGLLLGVYLLDRSAPRRS